MTVLPRDLFACSAPQLAPLLLNVLVVGNGRTARIVETEAYTADDPASHSYRGQTRRNRTMFGPPGHLYVYFIYGMHWCANVVCGAEGMGEAVLLRAAEPIDGIGLMRAARPAAKSDRDLCRGPAKLARAMGIDGSFDAVDLTDRNGPIVLCRDGLAPPSAPIRTPRVGISRATERPWRWIVPNSPWVSRQPNSR